MTQLQTVLTSPFGDLSVDVVKPDAGEPGVTRKQLGEMLGYSEPDKGIGKIHERNRERLQKWSVFVKMTGTDGKLYDTCVYGFKGILEICRYSTKPKSNAVIDWAWDTLDGLRRGTINPDSFHRLQYEYNRLAVDYQDLEQKYDEANSVVAMVRRSTGTFSMWEVTQHLFRAKIGTGNLDKTVKTLVANGMLQKDDSIKNQIMYKPYLRHIRSGYFDTPLTIRDEPVPVLQSHIVVTLSGLLWIATEFTKLERQSFRESSPLLSDYLQQRLFGLDPQVGGPITVADYNGVERKIS